MAAGISMARSSSSKPSISARPGGDAPSRIFIERCRELIANPPGPDWSPIAVQMEK